MLFQFAFDIILEKSDRQHPLWKMLTFLQREMLTFLQREMLTFLQREMLTFLQREMLRLKP